MPDFSPIIAEAYREILGREPDPSGLDFYNGRMNAGLSEAALREILLRSDEDLRKNDGFRPLVVDGAFNFEWRGYTSFGLFGRPLEGRVSWVERGVAEGRTVFRAFSDTSFWPSDPLLDLVPKHRAVDASGLHPSPAHLDLVRETVREAFSPRRAILEYVILVTQFEENGGPLFRRFPETENYVLEVIDCLERPSERGLLARKRDRHPRQGMGAAAGQPDAPGNSSVMAPGHRLLLVGDAARSGVRRLRLSRRFLGEHPLSAPGFPRAHRRLAPLRRAGRRRRAPVLSRDHGSGLRPARTTRAGTGRIHDPSLRD